MELRKIYAHEHWRGLFDRLGGEGLFNITDAYQFHNGPIELISLEFLASKETFFIFQEVLPKLEKNADYFIVDASRTFSIKIQEGKDGAIKLSSDPLRLCHFAYEVSAMPCLSKNVRFGTNFSIIDAPRAYDPGLRCEAKLTHIYSSGCYLTLISSGEIKLNHFGWQASDRNYVDIAYGVVKSLKWPIIVEPTWLDGSYLFHFEGPDRRIHDFFYVDDSDKFWATHRSRF